MSGVGELFTAASAAERAARLGGSTAWNDYDKEMLALRIELMAALAPAIPMLVVRDGGMAKITNDDPRYKELLAKELRELAEAVINEASRR